MTEILNNFVAYNRNPQQIYGTPLKSQTNLWRTTEILSKFHTTEFIGTWEVCIRSHRDLMISWRWCSRAQFVRLRDTSMTCEVCLSGEVSLRCTRRSGEPLLEELEFTTPGAARAARAPARCAVLVGRQIAYCK